MGKQLSIYLDDEAEKRLIDMSQTDCRRIHDQARFILLSGLGLIAPTRSSRRKKPRTSNLGPQPCATSNNAQ